MNHWMMRRYSEKGLDIVQVQNILNNRLLAGVVKSVDAADSKSAEV